MSKAIPTINVLRAARKLVANPKTWTLCAMGRTTNRSATRADDPNAVCWCAAGAIVRSGHERGLTYEQVAVLWPSLDRIACDLYGDVGLFGANDTLGRLFALTIIDSAIDELRRR